MPQAPTKKISNQTLQLVLASESPRRKDLLERAEFFFHVFSVKVSEQLEKNLTDKLTMDEQILEIARRKAIASLLAYKPSEGQGFLILAADTMVIYDKEALGKPDNEEMAFKFLKNLSGQSHEVKTAVILVEGPAPTDFREEFQKNPDKALKRLKMKHTVETTTVIFRHLSDREIKEYIQSGEPMDKAGAYGIQGLGGQFVEKVIGSFDNVVGLSVDAVKRLLKEGEWKLKS